MTVVLIFLVLYLCGGITTVTWVLRTAKETKLFDDSSDVEISITIFIVFLTWPYTISLALLGTLGGFIRRNFT
jgi:hypothetical protein